RHEPPPRQLLRDPVMRQRTIVPLSALLLLGSACGGRAGPVATSILPATADSGPAVTVDSLGAVVARQAGDSAADQAVLASLHAPRGRHADSLTSRPAAAAQGAAAVRGEDGEREAVRLVGPGGRAAVGGGAG